MSVLDEYEHRRGPVRRRNWQREKAKQRPKPGEVQLALKLYGGTTAKDKGAPFDDPIPF